MINDSTTDSKYACPMCEATMKVRLGNVFHLDDPKFGMTVYCPNQVSCPCEVFAHDEKESGCYEIIVGKYKKHKN